MPAPGYPFSRLAPALVGALALAGSARAQTLIHPENKWAWGENIGWLNWRDANGAMSGVRVHESFLSGFIWGENIGWINTGDGSPANGAAYSNATGADFGVNVNPVTGELSGLAWGENIGWINFSTTAALPAGQGARLDLQAGRFRGYAWGENIGWINLDDPARFVALADCPGDTNGDGIVNFSDLNTVLNQFGQSGSHAGDVTGDGVVNFSDLNLILNAFGQACP